MSFTAFRECVAIGEAGTRSVEPSEDGVLLTGDGVGQLIILGEVDEAVVLRESVVLTILAQHLEILDAHEVAGIEVDIGHGRLDRIVVALVARHGVFELIAVGLALYVAGSEDTTVEIDTGEERTTDGRTQREVEHARDDVESLTILAEDSHLRAIVMLLGVNHLGIVETDRHILDSLLALEELCNSLGLEVANLREGLGDDVRVVIEISGDSLDRRGLGDRERFRYRP